MNRHSQTIDCSQPAWMIEAGKLLGECREIQLVGLEPTAGNYSFLQALGNAEALDIQIADRTATIRRPE